MIGQLTNHLWQSTFFALAAALLTLAFRANRAKVRYSLWWIASLKFLIPFSLLVSLGSQLHLPPAKQIAPSPVVLQTIEQMSEPFFFDTSAVPPSPQPHADWILPAAGAAWLCGLVAIAWVRWRAWRGIRTAIRLSVPITLPLPVEARLTSGILEPGVVGLWRPILLLPEGILDRLSASELEAVLAHELCHIRRRDNLCASIHMVVEAVFWFHPLVWWIGARLVDERERACDEHVVSLGNRPDVYADAILSVCKLYAESPVPCVSGVTGADIRRRIEAIMSNRGAAGLNLAKKALLAGAGVVAVAAPVAIGLLIGVGHVPRVHAQNPVARPVEQPPALVAQQEAPKPPAPPKPEQEAKPQPKFDAASIRPCAPGSVGPGRGGQKSGAGIGPAPALGGYFSRSPGRFNASCASIMTMINIAYVNAGDKLINDSGSPLRTAERTRGLPEWTVSARYNIEAVTDDPVANGPTQGMNSEAWKLMSGPMFRSLLEERFHVKLHREVEEVPMYALTVAKGGLKLKEPKDGDCTPPEHGPNGGFIMRPLGPNDKPYCQWMGGTPHGPNRTVLGGGVTMERLADFLSNFVMDRHVIDRTGIDTTYNIHLEYSPDERTPCTGPPQACQVDANTDIPAAPSIFTAIEQQLGLKLESTKGPHGIIMVDHVERPTEN
jgi:bla regulator protein blaR1